MKFEREDIGIILAIIIPAMVLYAVLSIVALGVRVIDNDCKIRYIDFVAPISRLHCEVK